MPCPITTFHTSSPISGAQLLDPRRCEDDLIAYTLIQIWALTTGRVLRDDLPPDLLTEEELIAFWADPALVQGGA